MMIPLIKQQKYGREECFGELIFVSKRYHAWHYDVFQTLFGLCMPGHLFVLIIKATWMELRKIFFLYSKSIGSIQYQFTVHGYKISYIAKIHIFDTSSSKTSKPLFQPSHCYINRSRKQRSLELGVGDKHKNPTTESVKYSICVRCRREIAERSARSFAFWVADKQLYSYCTALYEYIAGPNSSHKGIHLFQLVDI